MKILDMSSYPHTTVHRPSSMRRRQRGILIGKGWWCLYAVVLFLRVAPAAAVGQQVPTELSDMTREQAPEDGWIDKSQCETHSQCAAGEFCKWTWCGVTLVSLATSLLSRSSRKVSARTPLEQGQARCEQLTSACSV